MTAGSREKLLDKDVLYTASVRADCLSDFKAHVTVQPRTT